ncbi:MAG TPA: hypothetical protein VGK40_03970 [Verrucomicrobiae bacterium]|jgi:hypothetical protein
MNPIGLKNIVAPQLDRAFDLAGELVRDSIFYKTESNPCTGLLTMAALYAPVKALCVDYHSQDIDGSAVLVGDEKCFIRASELTSITLPGAGDYLTETISGQRREVIAARLDPTDSFWIMQVRRSATEDWGDLNLFSQAEDWGDLTTAVVFDDWQS